jgi:transmembrane sensor
MQDSLLIEEIAANWLARRDGGDWTAGDEASLKAWIEASTAHRVAFIRLEAAWRKALQSFPPGLGGVPQRRSARENRARRDGRRSRRP